MVLIQPHHARQRIDQADARCACQSAVHLRRANQQGSHIPAQRVTCIMRTLDEVHGDGVPYAHQTALGKAAHGQPAQLLSAPERGVKRGWPPPRLAQDATPVPVPVAGGMAAAPIRAPDSHGVLVRLCNAKRYVHKRRLEYLSLNQIVCASPQASVILMGQSIGRNGHRQVARRGVEIRAMFAADRQNASDFAWPLCTAPKHPAAGSRVSSIYRNTGLGIAPKGTRACSSYCGLSSPVPRCRFPARGSGPERRSSWRTSSTSSASAAASAPAP